MYAGAYHQRLRSQAASADSRRMMKQIALIAAFLLAGIVVYRFIPNARLRGPVNPIIKRLEQDSLGHGTHDSHGHDHGSPPSFAKLEKGDAAIQQDANSGATTAVKNTQLLSLEFEDGCTLEDPDCYITTDAGSGQQGSATTGEPEPESPDDAASAAASQTVDDGQDAVRDLESGSGVAGDGNHGHDHGHEEPRVVPPNASVEGPAADASLPPRKPVAPPRDPGWAPEQRPRPDSNERTLTSHAFEELAVRSLSPPVGWATSTVAEQIAAHGPDSAAELASRLVIALGMGVHSGHTDIENKGLMSLPIFYALMKSFLRHTQPHHIYRLYFAFDHNDPVYEKASWRQKITDEIMLWTSVEDGKRWHPPGYVAGETVDGSTLVVQVHWVHCDYSSKPSWAHSDAIMAAYKEGADYAFRVNDDTELPDVADWVDKFIIDLRSRKPVPNLGIVGPYCKAGASYILTHDFSHRTHAMIFGYHYPRSLPNWSSDDWITYLYEGYGLMSKRMDVEVVHKMHGQRYDADPRDVRLAALRAAMEEGARALDEFTQREYGVTIPHTFRTVDCC